MTSNTNNKFPFFSLAKTWTLGFISAMALVAAFYTAFLGREFVVPSEKIYEGVEYVNAPGSTQVARMEGYGVTTYGKDGLVVNKQLKNEIKKVLFWGDSFVKAIHVSDKDKFTEIIEREWNTKYPEEEIQTLNIGQAGLDNRAYIQFSNNVDAVFSPDLVFLMLGIADFKPLATRKGLEKQIKDGNYDNLLNSNYSSRFRTIINDIGLHAFVVRIKRQTFAFLKDSRNEPVQPETNHELNEVNLRDSIQSQLDALNAIWGDRLVIVYRHRISDYGDSIDEGQNTALYKIMIEKNIRFIDTYIAFSEAMKNGIPPHGFANSNLGHGHFNHAGHKIVAGLVVNYLENLQ